MADDEFINTGSGREASTSDLSDEAREVLTQVLILERDNVHLERPRIRKELTDLIKNHVR